MNLIQKSILIFIAFILMLLIGMRRPSLTNMLIFTVIGSLLVIWQVILILKENPPKQ